MLATLIHGLRNVRPNSFLIKRWKNTNKNQLILRDPFPSVSQRDRATYMELVKIFEGKDVRRRGHVEFIYAALAQMKEFGVHKDLEAYKALLEVFPKEKMVPTNIFQAEFMHYPKQQQCAVDLLEQMEDNGVMPDTDMEIILLRVFGRRGIPLRKYWRMMYWMPKFRNLSPWSLPPELPKDTQELALLAIKRISSVDADTKVDVWQTEDVEASIDKTWIVTAQSPAQRQLLSEQPPDEPLTIKGPYTVYLKDQCVSYFVLFGKIRPEFVDDTDIDDVSSLKKPLGIPGVEAAATNLPVVKNTVHEQDDGTILAICATGSSSRDSLLSWIRLLEKHDNPLLASIPVIFTLIAPTTDLSVIQNEESSNKTDENIKPLVK